MTQTVRDIGEFGLIAALRGVLSPAVKSSPDLVLGIGDDAAVWTPKAGEQVVITTDSLVENVHFRLDWTDWRSLGHKSLAVNLSDLAAMGAAPKVATITIGLTGNELVADLEDLYRGVDALAAPHHVMIAGGDIVASPTGLFIDVTALGETRDRKVLTRSGARVGDLICVSGTLGASAAGYQLLLEGSKGPHAKLSSAELLIAAHLRPQPRIALGKLLLEKGATSAMDLSDGLLGDLPKILEMSGVSARIDLGNIPVAPAVRALLPDDWLELATRGGEDYELLFTVHPERLDDLVRKAEDVGATISAIGEIVAARPGDPLIMMSGPSGDIQAAELGAFDHFGSGA
jgi:thiamine-monophosphate kinase